ncbi:MAG: hypothetical protein ACLT08_08525 [Roseburia inulinivorans]
MSLTRAVMKELTDKFQEQYSDVDFNITIGAVSEQEAEGQGLRRYRCSSRCIRVRR